MTSTASNSAELDEVHDRVILVLNVCIGCMNQHHAAEVEVEGDERGKKSRWGNDESASARRLQMHATSHRSPDESPMSDRT